MTKTVKGRKAKSTRARDDGPRLPRDKIDVDITAKEIIELFRSGKKDAAVAILAKDHPGLAALVLVQGYQDKKLNLLDLNYITNVLVDYRVAALPAQAKATLASTLPEGYHPC